MPSSYFADLCPGSKIGREGQVSCETLISNQRFKKPNISFPFSEDRALHIQESCSHKLGGGWRTNSKRLKRDFYRELPGSGGEISRLADITLKAATRERSARDSSSPVMATARCQVASKSPDI